MSATVLVIGPTPPPYHGVAVATQSLLKAPADCRVEFVLLDIADRRGIEHVDKPDVHDVVQFCRQWLQLLRIVRTRRPRVAYLAISQSTVGFTRDAIYLLTSRLLGCRVVIHLHGGNLGPWYAERSRVMRWFVRGVLRRCTRFVVLAESLRNSVAGLVTAEKIVVVPNGVRWDGLGHHRAGERRPYELLFLSTLSRAKGALLLLEAMEKLIVRRRDVHLTLAGPWLHPEEEQYARRFVADRNLHGYVALLGGVYGSAKAELYTKADLFIFPGLQQEGQPLVVLEAMAAAIPVMFCERGCLAETVSDGECGRRFRCGDSSDLAEQIRLLLERPEEMQRLGSNGRRRYEEHYSERQFISNMTRVFMDAAGVTT